ncbi:MAG TPA: hypothetical protein VFS00_06135, partial [Polyangiaceae bacterium]|nr:hypothetical protein [Polyangiaceae bacterium]
RGGKREGERPAALALGGYHAMGSSNVGKSVAALLGEGLVSRRLVIGRAKVVFVRAHLEASEGLGIMFAERGGDLVPATPEGPQSELTLATPEGQERELDAFIDDLCTEYGARRVGPDP